MDQGSSPLGSNPPRQGPPDNLPRPSDASASQKSEGIDLRFPDSMTAQSLPKPPTPSSPSVPIPPSPASTTKGPATTSVPTEYKTSIRTMAEDIAKVKVGQRPSGVEIQKTIPLPRPAVPAPMPQPIAPVSPRTQASLGQPERSRPLAPAAPMPRPIIPVRPILPEASLPEVARPASGSRGILYMIIAGILLAGGGLYWILSGSDEVAQTPTPTAIASRTPTPTPTPDISSFISGTTDTITLATTGNVTADFLNKINALAINPGEIRKIVVSSETKGSGDFGMIDLLSQLGLPYPAALETAFGADSLILVFGQRESFTATGQPNLSVPTQKRIIFLSEVKGLAVVMQTLQTWEATMADSFASVFSLTKAKASGTGFSSNTYFSTNIRYRNFAYPDKAIDHALISAPNGKPYLMVAGSRESAFSAIDALR